MMAKPTGTPALTFVTVVLLIFTSFFVIYRAATLQTGLGYYRIVQEGSKLSRGNIQPRDIITGDQELQIGLKAELGEPKTKAEIEAFDREFAKRIEQSRTGIFFSWQRTIGIWVAAFMTLAIMSFLWRDNPAYRLAESIFVGISAAYWMVVVFYTSILGNLLDKLFPRFTKANFTPYADLDERVEELAQKNWMSQWGIVDYESAVGSAQTAHWIQLMDLWYWIPALLSIFLVWRLMPKGQWLSRYAIAYVMGATAGLKMFAFLSADFVSQIQNAIQPLYVPVYEPDQDGQMVLQLGKTFFESFMRNTLLLLSTLSVLVYFFFSLEHKGVVGKVSRIGVWVLMITFGAGFGYTVMGRIALLVGRFEFLIKDWLGYSPVA